MDGFFDLLIPLGFIANDLLAILLAQDHELWEAIAELPEGILRGAQLGAVAVEIL